MKTGLNVICKNMYGWMWNGFLHHLTEKSLTSWRTWIDEGVIVSITITCMKGQPQHARISIVPSYQKYQSAHFKKSLISILVLLSTCASFFIWAFFYIQRRGETFWLLFWWRLWNRDWMMWIKEGREQGSKAVGTEQKGKKILSTFQTHTLTSIAKQQLW